MKKKKLQTRTDGGAPTGAADGAHAAPLPEAPKGAASQEAVSQEAAAPIGAASQEAASKEAASTEARASDGATAAELSEAGISRGAMAAAKCFFTRSVDGKSAHWVCEKSVPNDRWSGKKKPDSEKLQEAIRKFTSYARPIGEKGQLHQCYNCGRTEHAAPE